MLRGIAIILIIIVLYRNAYNIKHQIGASAFMTAMWSIVSVILLSISIVLIIKIPTGAKCVFGY